MFELKYNDVAVPSFVKVTGISQYPLPALTHNVSTIPNYFGDLDGGVSVGGKAFKVSMLIIKDDTHDDYYYSQQLGLWLIGNDYKVSSLKLDNSGTYYMARPTDIEELQDHLTYFTTTVTFTASNPRRYAATETVINLITNGSLATGVTRNTTTRVITFTNSYTGDIPLYPYFELGFNSNCTAIKIENSTHGGKVVVNHAFSTSDATLKVYNDEKKIRNASTSIMTSLDLSTSWLLLKNGSNIITVTYTGNSPYNLTMKYTPIYY